MTIYMIDNVKVIKAHIHVALHVWIQLCTINEIEITNYFVHVITDRIRLSLIFLLLLNVVAVVGVVDVVDGGHFYSLKSLTSQFT